MQSLHRKLAAACTIAIFLVSIFAIFAPAQATFTVGNLSGTNPYEINNFDPHVAGPSSFSYNCKMYGQIRYLVDDEIWFDSYVGVCREAPEIEIHSRG